MLELTKNTIKKTLSSVGWDLKRINPASHPGAQLLAAINHIEADTVFDVGAKTGQFAQGLRSVGFFGTIASFDPLSKVHAQLTAASARDPAWLVMKTVKSRSTSH